MRKIQSYTFLLCFLAMMAAANQLLALSARLPEMNEPLAVAFPDRFSQLNLQASRLAQPSIPILMMATIFNDDPTSCFAGSDISTHCSKGRTMPTYCPHDEHIPSYCPPEDFSKPTFCKGPDQPTKCPGGQVLATRCTNGTGIEPTVCAGGVGPNTLCLNNKTAFNVTHCPDRIVTTLCYLWHDPVTPSTTFCPDGSTRTFCGDDPRECP